MWRLPNQKNWKQQWATTAVYPQGARCHSDPSTRDCGMSGASSEPAVLLEWLKSCHWGGGVVPLLTKHSHLGIEPKSSGLRSHRANGPSRGWTSGEAGVGGGRRRGGSQVSEMFLCIDAALWGICWLVQQHWEEIKAWILNVLGLWDASSPGNSVIALFSSKNCLLIYRFTVSGPREGFPLMKDGWGLWYS